MAIFADRVIDDDDDGNGGGVTHELLSQLGTGDSSILQQPMDVQAAPPNNDVPGSGTALTTSYIAYVQYTMHILIGCQRPSLLSLLLVNDNNLMKRNTVSHNESSKDESHETDVHDICRALYQFIPTVLP